MDKRDVLTAFLQAWANEDYEQMYQFTQKTWKEKHTIEFIKVLFQDAKLKKFNIFSDTFVSNSAHKFTIDFTLSSGDRLMSVVNVICEEAPFTPRPYGEWGVNPVSVQNIVSNIPAEKKPPVKNQNSRPKTNGKK